MKETPPLYLSLSCLELTRSMLKEDYIAQVKAHCYMTSIFEATHRDEDPVRIFFHVNDLLASSTVPGIAKTYAYSRLFNRV